jgi:hypothetical protein
MAGDARVRHCTLCDLNVYNFAEMTREEVHALLQRSEGRVCARLFRRADGTVLTRDCPTGLRALRVRVSRVAAAALALLLAVPVFALDAVCKKPRVRTRGSKVKFKVEQVAAAEAAVFSGVTLLDDAQLPGVSVTVRNEVFGDVHTAISDGDGAFAFRSLRDGLYSVEITMAGMKPAKIEHLELRAGRITNARVSMELSELGESVVVGALAVPAMEQQAISTTFTQDFIDKMPH